jgi:hypothetical protein
VLGCVDGIFRKKRANDWRKFPHQSLSLEAHFFHECEAGVYYFSEVINAASFDRRFAYQLALCSGLKQLFARH